MELKEWLSQQDPDEVIYLGCDGEYERAFKSNGSGFVYIGYVRNTPLEQFGDRMIIDLYPHETDYFGMTVIIDGSEHGKYWMWHEYDPSVPIKELGFSASDEQFENLLMAMARQTAQDYRIIIRDHIRTERPTAMSEVDDIIRLARTIAELDFLKGSQTGEYLIRRVEDEERILWKYPKAKYYPPEKRTAFFEAERKKLIAERIKQQEKSLYAKIRGRSVKHG